MLVSGRVNPCDLEIKNFTAEQWKNPPPAVVWGIFPGWKFPTQLCGDYFIKHSVIIGIISYTIINNQPVFQTTNQPTRIKPFLNNQLPYFIRISYPLGMFFFFVSGCILGSAHRWMHGNYKFYTSIKHHQQQQYQQQQQEYQIAIKN